MAVINGDNLPNIPNGSRITPLLVLSVFGAVFGSSTQFGFNLAVMNNIETVVRSSLSQSNNTLVISDHFTNIQWATAVAIFAAGGMIGSLLAGVVADLIGRKWSMMINNVLVIVAVCLQSIAIVPSMLIMGRFVIGINAGANTVLAPLYITEVSPIPYRGIMGVFHQVAITITILIAQLLGIHQVLGQSDDNGFYGWRILLAIPIVFMIVQIIVLPFCPQSPKYLYIKKHKVVEATNALKKLCGPHGYQSELDALEKEYSHTETQAVLVTLKSLIVNGGLRRAILVSIALHLSQQITGIGSILLYSTEIFEKSGIRNGDIVTVIIGGTLLIGSIVTIFLIKYIGRKTLMLYGLGGMLVFYSLLSATLCYQFAFYYDTTAKYTPTGILLVVFAVGIVFAFSIGPGVIPWLIVGELFQQATRPTAVSVATITNWSSNFVVGFIFPFMLKYMIPYSFIVFIVITGFFWLIIYIYLPETKDKTVEEITYEFDRDANRPSLCFNRGNNNGCGFSDTPI